MPEELEKSEYHRGNHEHAPSVHNDRQEEIKRRKDKKRQNELDADAPDEIQRGQLPLLVVHLDKEGAEKHDDYEQCQPHSSLAGKAFHSGYFAQAEEVSRQYGRNCTETIPHH